LNEKEKTLNHKGHKEGAKDAEEFCMVILCETPWVLLRVLRGLLLKKTYNEEF
jgi:hypothetical protein